jgi:hypothetical protein
MSRRTWSRITRLEQAVGRKGPVLVSRTIVEGGEHPTPPQEAAAARAWAAETGGLLIVVRLHPRRAGNSC